MTFLGWKRLALAVLVPLVLAACSGLPVETAAHLPRQPTATRPPTALPPTATPTSTPIPTPTATPFLSRTAGVNPGYIPILMYHYIRVVNQEADPLGFRLSVTPERFAEQMAWLAASDYTPMRMRDVVACLRGQLSCPPSPVALTFDDGYDDNALNALPVLKRYGIPATFYVVAGSVGTPGYMTWAQLAELQESGMEIGSHTVTHADLTVLTIDQARDELVRSRELLEAGLGQPVESFSYPAGSYSAEVAELVREVGYTSAVTTQQTRDLSQLYQLARRRVMGGETIAGYPWYFQAP